MAAEDPQTAALLTHVVSQVESNVEFLASHGYITQTDASQFLSKLPRTSVPSFPVVSVPVQIQTSEPLPLNNTNALPQARALWAWRGEDEGDLFIEKDDIIEIVEERNADWWVGRVNGRQGIFPANYVQRILAPVAPATASSEKPVYKPFRAAYHGMDHPPQAGAVNSVGLQEQPGTEQKKSKYGKLGNTMAHSAAGGVGFGAGAAIGGGLIHAIF